MITGTNNHTKTTKNYFTVAPGVWGMKDVFVNFYMIANASDNSWVLVDTGLKTSAGKIKQVAHAIFGDGARPKYIVLTHAHFDHVGSLEALVEEWKVPVYAHYLELPYLTGKASYPPPDPLVGGGIMPLMSVIFPRGPINLWSNVNALDEDGRVPGLPDWKFLHTPGHAPGHISLYRQEDGLLIAGDAFVTTNQQSALSVLFQTKIVTGPPKYFTYDWELAKQSVKELMKLEPEIVATGHGKPMEGSEMRKALHHLYLNFAEQAVPHAGRYVNDPAVADATGFIYIPPSYYKKRSLILGVLGVNGCCCSSDCISGKAQTKGPLYINCNGTGTLRRYSYKI